MSTPATPPSFSNSKEQSKSKEIVKKEGPSGSKEQLSNKKTNKQSECSGTAITQAILIILIVISVLAILGLIVCIHFHPYFNGRSESQATDSSETEQFPTTTEYLPQFFWDKDCAALKARGITKSGKQLVELNGQFFEVYCDMETDGGGWTVIQQRVDGTLPFWNKTWEQYKIGFGEPGKDTNFWAGNELIHRLTSKDENTILRIELWGDRDPGSNHANDYWWGEYYMKVGDEASGYQLNIIGKFMEPTNKTNITMVGNASTAWFDVVCNNNFKFSTIDKVNDPMEDCVLKYKLGGWWLHHCGTVSLNGAYDPPIANGTGYGFVWMVDGFYQINPAKSRMSLKPEKPGTPLKNRNCHNFVPSYDMKKK
uniref:Fibrinogen C-terminal domain-containing protein n=1 Tax=Panagrolaimus sp. JU765 TaxID=591449 RepID=A0AC34RD64_9BILA